MPMVTMSLSWLEQFLPRSRESVTSSSEKEETRKQTVEATTEETNQQKKEEMMEISSEAISTSTYQKLFESQKFTFGVYQGLVLSWLFHSFTNPVYLKKQSIKQLPIGSKL